MPDPKRRSAFATKIEEACPERDQHTRDPKEPSGYVAWGRNRAIGLARALSEHRTDSGVRFVGQQIIEALQTPDQRTGGDASCPTTADHDQAVERGRRLIEELADTLSYLRTTAGNLVLSRPVRDLDEQYVRVDRLLNETRDFLAAYHDTEPEGSNG